MYMLNVKSNNTTFNNLILLINILQLCLIYLHNKLICTCESFRVVINNYLIPYACTYIYFACHISFRSVWNHFIILFLLRENIYMFRTEQITLSLSSFLLFGNISVTFLVVYESDVHTPKMRQVSLYSQATSEISDVSLLIFFPRKSGPPAGGRS